MWVFKTKNGDKPQIMRFETMQEVAEYFNFFEDIYVDEIWDKFISDLERVYEIEFVEERKNVPLIIPNVEEDDDDDDLIF